MQGTDVVWTDAAAGVAVCACGSSNFAAVGLQDGSVLVRAGQGGFLDMGGCSVRGLPDAL